MFPLDAGESLLDGSRNRRYFGQSGQRWSPAAETAAGFALRFVNRSVLGFGDGKIHMPSDLADQLLGRIGASVTLQGVPGDGEGELGDRSVVCCQDFSSMKESPRASPEYTPKEMKFGVIGWGLRRPIAELAHKPQEGYRLAALADPDAAAQQRFKSFVGEDAFTTADYRDLLDRDLDGVFILSPDYLHEEQAITCLRAGKPVYLEKPMAITVEGCDRILEAAKGSGTRLYLGHNMRHFPVIRKMKVWIDEGRIGKVQTAWCRHFVSYGGEAYYRDWHADRRKSTGLLLQKGAHDIDVLHWLCGGYSKRVTAMGKLMVYGDIADRQRDDERIQVKFERTWPPRSLSKLYPVTDVEDVNMMLMELDNGVLASYQHCMFTPDAWRNYTVIGDEGRIENFGDGPGATVKLWNSASRGYAPVADFEEVLPETEGTHGGSDPAILAEFIRYLREGGETDTSPYAARMAVAAGVAATRSLRSGSVSVDVD